MAPTESELPRQFARGLSALKSAMEAAGGQYAIIGGVAVALSGYLRNTVDLDAIAIFDFTRIDEFAAIFQQHGFELGIPDAVAFTRRNYVLKLVHHKTGVPVDIAFAFTPFEQEAIAKSRLINLEKRIMGQSVGIIPTAMHKGYYRFPTIYGDTVAFVCEDDLWTVSVEGGIARRLTTSLSAVITPRYSPDGRWIAFVARDEGHPEVYVMTADGGEPRRLTYQGAARAEVVGWTPDGSAVIYNSTAGRPPREIVLWRVALEGGLPVQYPYGLANHISFGPNGAVILGRHTGDPARWKRYRGGTAGVFWIDREGNGEFVRFKPTDGDLTAPMWIGERIYFVSDHEGIANIYSCLPDGSDLQRHTHHEEYYVRYPSTDGKRIVYHAGADLYVLDIATGENRLIPVELRSPRMQAQRKFVDTAKYLQEYTLHPEGHSLLLTVRGKPFVMGNWEGAVIQHGEPQGVRYRLSQFLNDGKRLITVSDESGEPRLELHTPDGVTRYEEFDIGHPYRLEVCPTADRIALSNHRFELHIFDIEKRELKLVERSEYAMIEGFAWSPCGRWLAYSFAPNERTHIIKIYDSETGAIHPITQPEFRDVQPAWDPDGELLYFISLRDYDPVPDNLQFEMAFPMGMRVMAVVLRKDIPNPLLPQPRPFEEKKG